MYISSFILCYLISTYQITYQIHLYAFCSRMAIDAVQHLLN